MSEDKMNKNTHRMLVIVIALGLLILTALGLVAYGMAETMDALQRKP